MPPMTARARRAAQPPPTGGPGASALSTGGALLPSMRLVLVLSALVAPALAGCFFFDAPCHEFPPEATAVLPANATRASIREALAEEGWSLGPDKPGSAVVANKEQGSHDFRVRAFPSDMESGLTITVAGGPVAAKTQDELRAVLAPVADPLFERLEAEPEPEYRPGSRHCGSV